MVMAESRASKHTASDPNATPTVEQLRVEREQARSAGDDARVAQLDQQIREAGGE
jgi:hypothetical protein